MTQEAAPRRILSLDVFRGVTVAGMIVVDSPGSDDWYSWAAHSAWNGLTPADLVFPAFLLAMGCSLALSLGGHIARGEPRASLAWQALRRSAIIFAFGLLTSFIMFESGSWPCLRLLGVLPRISLCYLACSMLFLAAPESLPWAAAGILLLYWALLRGDLSPAGNLAGIVDRKLLGGHLLGDPQDPEGLFSTFPAVASALFGVIAGGFLRPRDGKARAFARLAAAGAGLLAAGALWDRWFPFNKHLWTSSYAVFSAGAGLLGLAACYGAIELAGWTAWSKPFEVLGSNPLIAYFSSELFYGVSEFIPVRVGGRPENVKLWLTHHLFSPWLSPKPASLAYALAYALCCTALMWALHRRKLFLRI